MAKKKVPKKAKTKPKAVKKKTAKAPKKTAKPKKAVPSKKPKAKKAVPKKVVKLAKKPVFSTSSPVKKSVLPVKSTSFKELKKVGIPVQEEETVIDDIIIPRKQVQKPASVTTGQRTKSDSKYIGYQRASIKADIQALIAKLQTRSSATMKDKKEISIEDKLIALYDLQQIDSTIDRIRTIRGELPMEVRDLEDEVAGLETRLKNLADELAQLEEGAMKKKQSIKDAQALIKKYEQQQANVKNNREYDSLTKEIEFQKLEIQLAEKRIKEFAIEVESKNSVIETSTQTLKERKNDLDLKKAELDSIIAETQKEEETLIKRSAEAGVIIEERLVAAYNRVRLSAANGLAVVTVQRDSCGGCFNKIPPQRQLEIKQRKKIIVCEHCGRILVDAEIEGVRKEQQQA